MIELGISALTGKKSSEGLADQLCRIVDHRDDAGIVQAGWTDDAQNAHNAAFLILEGLAIALVVGLCASIPSAFIASRQNAVQSLRGN